MATKKFIIEVEEGWTICEKCRLVDTENGRECWIKRDTIDCFKYNLATMKMTEYNEGQALLYAVEKTAKRTKREMIEEVVEWMRNNLHEFSANVSYKSLFDEFKKAMQDESK